MKRFIAPAAALVLVSSAFISTDALAATATQRYIVETRPAVAHRFIKDADIAPERIVGEMSHLDMAVLDLTAEEAARLRHTAGVRRVELDHEVRALGTVTTNRTITSTARFQNAQNVPYGIDMVHAPQVWSVGKGAGIKVGIIDTGMDYKHPDLVDRYKGGYDFVSSDEDPMDENGHGTHVAGTIGASDNGMGVVGVAPKAELYSLRVLDKDGKGSNSSVIRAIDWAIDHKLNIISLSLGSDEPSDIEEAAFKKAADAGILAIAASGNGYDTMQADGLSYPAGYSTVVSVGAIDSNRGIADFSQRGADLKLVAPGVSVLSTVPVGSAQIAEVTVGSINALGVPMTGTPQASITGDLVYCGLGGLEEFPASVSGKVALIQRGTYKFWEKVANAKAKGAIGAVIFNKEPGLFSGTVVTAPNDPNYQPTRSGDPTYPSSPSYQWIPAMSISQEDGLRLKNSSTATAKLEFGEKDDFENLDGTSMATPHVSGVAALVWSLAPNATAAQIREALISTAHDEGNAGFDTVFGNGIVDALAAARHLAPGDFPSTPRRRSVQH